MSGAPFSIDRSLARRRFARAARSYARAARLEAEIGARMLERLDFVKIAPRRILDAGSGPAREARALARRYRGSQVIALDFSLAMLREALRGGGPLSRIVRRARPHAVCADLERLPIADARIGLVWSNMALHWLTEPLVALREFARVLESGGLLVFSTLGPDTLKELRSAAPGRVHRFIDMHDLGDRLVAAGFADPVMDMEIVTLSYAAPERMLDALRLTGQTNSSAARARGLSGRAFGARLHAALREGAREGRVSATCEVVYGLAWRAAAPRAPAGDVLQPVRLIRRPAK